MADGIMNKSLVVRVAEGEVEVNENGFINLVPLIGRNIPLFAQGTTDYFCSGTSSLSTFYPGIYGDTQPNTTKTIKVYYIDR